MSPKPNSPPAPPTRPRGPLLEPLPGGKETGTAEQAAQDHLEKIDQQLQHVDRAIEQAHRKKEHAHTNPPLQ